MQYIGELCRYLLKAPVTEYDSKLMLKTAYGNGLRPDVWTDFQKKYNIETIVEFYASTEGNLALFNGTGKAVIIIIIIIIKFSYNSNEK